MSKSIFISLGQLVSPDTSKTIDAFTQLIIRDHPTYSKKYAKLLVYYALYKDYLWHGNINAYNKGLISTDIFRAQVSFQLDINSEGFDDAWNAMCDFDWNIYPSGLENCFSNSADSSQTYVPEYARVCLPLESESNFPTAIGISQNIVDLFKQTTDDNLYIVSVTNPLQYDFSIAKINALLQANGLSTQNSHFFLSFQEQQLSNLNLAKIALERDNLDADDNHITSLHRDLSSTKLEIKHANFENSEFLEFINHNHNCLG